MASVISKSVARVFEILELFRDTKEPMRAVDVRNALGYPQPSTLALLKNLAEIGYLSYDRKTKCYFPTSKLGTLGQWIQSASVGEGALADLVDQLSSTTDETASICGENDIHAQIIHTHKADHVLALQVEPGPIAPLCASAVGRTLLSLKDDKVIAEIIEETNRREKLKKSRIQHDPKEVGRTIRAIRAKGFCISYDLFLSGVGVVAFPIESKDHDQYLTLAVAGSKDRIKAKEDFIVRTMKSDIRRYGLAAKTPSVS